MIMMWGKELLVFAILLISLIHQTNSQTSSNGNQPQRVSHDKTNAECNGDAANSEHGGTQEAKPVRKARAIADTFLELLQWPFSLLSRLFQLIRLPISVVTSLSSLYTNLLGGWVFTVPMKLLQYVSSALWDVTKKSVLPRLDDFCMKLTDSDSIPDEIKSTINSAHSAYTWMKFFGFLRPV